MSIINDADRRDLRWMFSRWSESQFELYLVEYMKFLQLSSVAPVISGLPVCRDIDQLWHKHILMTESYMACCQKLGVKYIHHRPMTPYRRASKVTSRRDATTDLSWLVSYVDNFGPFAQCALPCWPKAQELVLRDGWPLAALNKNLKRLAHA